MKKEIKQQAKNKKKDNRKTCTTCKIQFRRKGRERRCSDCRFWSPFWSSSFGRFLLDGVKRTGYLDCIRDVSLFELNQLHARCTTFKQLGFSPGHGWGSVLNLELCHLQSAKEVKGCVGMLSPENLVIAPQDINRRLGSLQPKGLGVATLAKTPVPESPLALKKAIRNHADLTNIESCTFNRYPSKKGPKEFGKDTGDTYSTVLLSESDRLSIELDLRTTVLDGFLTLLTGDHPRDIPFKPLSLDNLLYSLIGEEVAFKAALDHALFRKANPFPTDVERDWLRRLRASY